MSNHGVKANEQATSVSTPAVATSGIPYVVGSAPIQSAETATKANTPVLCSDWDEAVAAFGYSDNWKKYTLCEAMYSHFKLFERQPIILCNVLDIKTGTTESVAATDLDLVDDRILLPLEALNNNDLVVKAEGGTGDPLVKDTDYSVYYLGENLVVEYLTNTDNAKKTKLNVAYSKLKTDISETDIVAGVEKIELCLTKVGTVPDLMLAPGFSHLSSVAAAMAAKADNINGIFKAKVLVDIDSSSATGATKYSDVLTIKSKDNITDSTEIACWPMIKLGEHKFHISTQLAGLMASVDTENDGCPYESPSNKNLKCDSLILADGTEVDLTLTEANTLNANGVVTAINFVNGWTAWGNYTACYPGNTDVKDSFIPVSRTFKWVENTLVKTFWQKIDDPMNRRLVDSVLDTANIWINGLVGMGYLLGGRVERLEKENPLTDVMAGKIRLHVYITPPSPAQEIDFITEYDADYITSSLG